MNLHEAVALTVRRWYLIAAIGAAAWVATAVSATPPLPAGTGPTETVPVVVELFTSEGCSSCPPADDVLTRLVHEQPVANADIIAIGEHVDYWDRLGWRDPFSSAAYSARQAMYSSRSLLGGDMYTPQMVVNGGAAFVGSDYKAAAAAIARATRASGPRVHVSLQVTRDTVSGKSVAVLATVDQAGTETMSGPADLFLAVVEDGLKTDVRRGENGGRQLHHSAVARRLTPASVLAPKTSSWTATTTIRVLPEWNPERTQLVAFVQDRSTRAIVGATRVAIGSGDRDSVPVAR